MDKATYDLAVEVNEFLDGESINKVIPALTASLVYAFVTSQVTENEARDYFFSYLTNAYKNKANTVH
jgi:hypothetical protein